MIPNVSSPYAHTGLTNDTTYYYIVTAVNQYGEGDESVEVSATPSLATPPLPPTTVSTLASNRTVNIVWTASQSAEPVTSYNIYWSVSSGVTKENGIKIAGVSSPYLHTQLINDKAYYYVVTGVNKYGEGNVSQEVSATPTRGNVPLSPTGLTATAGNFEATISWSDSSGATSYNIYWSTSSDISSQTGTKIEDVISPYSHSGLSEETTYYYVATSVNGYGESEESDKASVTIVNNRNDIFVAMGDSITVGYSLSNYNECYVPILSGTWGKAAVNKGVSGTLSSYGANVINSILTQYNPKYITIFYGNNDDGFYDVNWTIGNLRYMIQRAKAYGTKPVIATLTPVFGQWAWRKPFSIVLNQRIRQLALEQGINCADLEVAFGWNPAYIGPDGLHPNSTGHRIIANTFYNALMR